MRKGMKHLFLPGVAALAFALLNGYSVVRLPMLARMGAAGTVMDQGKSIVRPDNPPPSRDRRDSSRRYRPLRVSRLTYGGPAARAGLRRGDVVFLIDGIPTYLPTKIARLAANSRAGTTLEFTVLRGDEVKVVNVRLESLLSQIPFWLNYATNALCAIVFFGVGSLVYWRRPQDRRAVLFFWLCMPFAFLFSAGNLYGPSFADFSGPSTPLVLLFVILMLFVFPPLLHFSLIFPRPRPILETNPRILVWAYGLPTLLSILLAALVLPFWLFPDAARGLGYYLGYAARFVTLFSGRLTPPLVAVVLLAPVILLVWRCMTWVRRKGWKWLLLCRPGLVVSTLFFSLFLLCVLVLYLWQASLPSPVLVLAIAIGAVLLGLLVAQILIPIAACVSLFRSYRSASLIEKQQLRWPAWGTITAVTGSFLLGTLSAVLPHAAELGNWWLAGLSMLVDQLGSLCLLLIPVSFFFAITKYRLMDIHLVIRKTLIYGMVTGIVGFLCVVLAFALSVLLRRFSPAPGEWVATGATLAAVALILPVRNRAQAIVDRRFFRRRQDYPAALRLLSREILGSTDRKRLLNTAAGSLLEALNNRAAVIFLKQPEDRGFVPAAHAGLSGQVLSSMRFAANSTLPLRLYVIAPVEDLELPEPECEMLNRLRCVLLVPVRWKRELIAFLALGSKLSEEEYDEADREFLNSAADQMAIGLTNLQMAEQQHESDRAREIQQAFLPKEIPQVPGFSVAAMWQPARSVSGDYYDVLPLGEGRWGFVIADVSGKGVPAALLMSNLQANVKALAAHNVSPQALCEKLNSIMCGNIPPGKFITFFYAVVDPAARTLTCVNAGHNPPLGEPDE